MKLKIIKIKIGEPETEITYFNGDTLTDVKTKVRSAQQRDPRFSITLQELIPLVRDFLQLPKEWNIFEDVIIRQIEFTQTESMGDGVRFVLAKKMAKLNSPLIISSPLLYNSDKIPAVAHLGRAAFVKLERLKEHAKDFIAGKRAQRQLLPDVSGITEDMLEEDE